MKIQKPIIAPPVSSKKIWDTISLPKRGNFPPFGKWFGVLTILSLSKEGGEEGFYKTMSLLL